MKTMLYEQTHKDAQCNARTGIIHTDHGDIETPIFMPVGTKATVKTLTSEDLSTLQAQIILGNTYHLHLRPSEDLIDKAGGLHKFMQWNKPILTDSGGFQVFSLGAGKKDANEHTKLVNIDDDGVTFRSHIDGSEHRFTPEEAIRIQHKLGADIIMAFDECTPDDSSVTYATQAMERTHRWAQRCIAEHKKDSAHHGYKQFLFGIIQGGNHKALREASAKAITAMDFDGIAIGGESIGFNMEATKEILEWIGPYLPEDKPRDTMGLGFSPYDMFDAVEHGIDMFDCVAPTRMARNGNLYVHPETFNEFNVDSNSDVRKTWVSITNAQFKDDHTPLDPRLPESPINQYSRAYVHHLFKENELLGLRLATLHNVWYMLDICAKIRESIKEDSFLTFKQSWYEAL